MKLYCVTGRRNHGRPLKRLLDMWDWNGSTSGPNTWKIDDDDCWLGMPQLAHVITLHKYATKSIWPASFSVPASITYNCQNYDWCTTQNLMYKST
jgi:hypothetical protein